MAKATKTDDRSKFWRWTVVSLAVMFIGGNVIPTFSEITRPGMQQLCIFLGMLLMIAGTGDLIAPCLFGFTCMVVNGYMTGNAAVSALFAQTTVVQLMFLFAFTWGIGKCGAGHVIAKKVMALKFVQGRPRLFLTAYLLGMFFSGIFMGSGVSVPFYMPVWESVRDEVGYHAEDDISKFMLIGIFVCCVLGAFILPFQGMILMYISYFTGLMQEYNFEFNQMLHICMMVGVGVLFAFLYVNVIVAVMRVDISKLKNFDITKMEGMDEKSRTFTNRQKVLLGTFLLCMLYSFVLIFIPKSAPFYEKYNSISLSVVVMCAMAVLSLFRCREDGQPYMNLGEVMKNGVVWGNILLVAVFIIIGNSIGDTELGITTSLANALNGVFGNMPWPVFVVIAITAAVVCTNFISNMTSAMLIMSAVCPFVGPYVAAGINMSVLCTALIISCMSGYWTPSAFYTAPILHTREGMNYQFIFSKGLTASLIFIVTMSVSTIILGYVL
ncbi:hypothetical protein GPL15_06610 [Clostridium sp. MCC353]|uniref:hypothetical protein n=1 Tax=Clostridium sp. MCC353 TaxID=2592646 RepID=UPI001C02C1AC|nr:hypothetical protein [Clostridium sp. MCC353]MBT9776177.1 hypothetical protein [Clostridium sp. MCC353]